MSREPCLAVVGATGLVGREALAILASRGVPSHRVLALASERSAGVSISYGRTRISVQPFDLGVAGLASHILLCAGSAFARAHARALVSGGASVVDNSSAFRSDPDVPLIVPEVNGHILQRSSSQLFANPNCSTILLVVALDPIRRALGLVDVVVSTYQAVSGAGRAGLEALERECREEVVEGVNAQSPFPEPCAFNVFPHESAFDQETGLCLEERKLITESARLWADTAPTITPTCARVPVRRAHSQAVTFTVHSKASEREIRDLLRSAPGIEVRENPTCPPTPLQATGRDEVLVGRIRRAPSEPQVGPARRFQLWLCGDQLRKGAALNAIQILELLDDRSLGAACPDPQRAGHRDEKTPELAARRS